MLVVFVLFLVVVVCSLLLSANGLVEKTGRCAPVRR